MKERIEVARAFRVEAAVVVLAAVCSLAGCMSAFRQGPDPVADLKDRAEAPEGIATGVSADSAPSPASDVLAGPTPYEELPSPMTPAWPTPTAPEPGPLGTAAIDPVSDSPLDDLAAIEPEVSPEELEHERERVSSDAPTFDIPIEVNDQVLAWVDLYSGRMKPSFEAGLKRSGRYLKMFRRIFREEGVPEDLVYMAHVESGYKTSAYSRAHARGIFQFIAPTARRYGLRVDYWVDERSDPEKSARAAAAYMKKLYADFGDWHLALAAYNAGEGKIRSALKRSRKQDFWSIAKTRYIRRETKNHVPAILAATLLSKEPGKYGLRAEPDPPIRYETVPVDGAADLRVLARCAATDLETLRRLNPAIRRLQTPPDGRTEVRVPEGSGPRTAEALAAIPAGERVLYARHRVRPGDTLSTIAQRYGVGVKAIQSSNNMGGRTLIRVNQVLLVPTSASSRYGDLAPVVVESGRAGDVVTHRVRSGDTLYALSRRYATTPASIAAASGISTRKTLQIGERLTVVRGVRDPAAAVRVAREGSAATVGRATESSGGKTHTVRRGDTLWRIAGLYRTSVQALCSLNAISPSATIHPGMRLTVGLD